MLRYDAPLVIASGVIPESQPAASLRAFAAAVADWRVASQANEKIKKGGKALPRLEAETVENERRIAEATAREEGKPEAALPKIVEGRVNGYYKDMVLLEQASGQDPKKTVKALLDEAGVTVKEFARFEVGQA